MLHQDQPVERKGTATGRPLVPLAALAVLATLAATARAATPSVASFKFTVEGTQTSQASGTVRCEDESDTVAAASASETLEFSTPRSRTMQFVRAGRRINIVNFHSRHANGTTLYAKGTLERRSDFSGVDSESSLPPVCPGGAPDPGCGNATLTRIPLELGGNGRSVTMQAGTPYSGPIRPHVPVCAIPAPFSFPGLVGDGRDVGSAHVKYSARVPRSVFNKRRRVVTIHGRGRATGKTDDSDLYIGGADFAAKGSTTFRFTMRLRRVRLRS